MNDIAPAKLNLCLYVGRRRGDGLHELRSIFEPLLLADRLDFTFGDGQDHVECPGIEGENIAAATLAALRASAWAHPPIQVRIEKRIPVAAGLGGGSADAGAVLRFAENMGEDTLAAIGSTIGADVPSQIDPRPLLVGGSGEKLEPIPPPGPHGIILIPVEPGLSAREVYSEFDRLGGGRPLDELDALETKLREATTAGDSPLGYADLLVNDLEPAALSLRPEIAGALDALRSAGALVALVSGSGPTAFGLFSDSASAERALARVTPSHPHAILTGPAGSGAGGEDGIV